MSKLNLKILKPTMLLQSRLSLIMLPTLLKVSKRPSRKPLRNAPTKRLKPKLLKTQLIQLWMPLTKKSNSKFKKIKRPLKRLKNLSLKFKKKRNLLKKK